MLPENDEVERKRYEKIVQIREDTNILMKKLEELRDNGLPRIQYIIDHEILEDGSLANIKTEEDLDRLGQEIQNLSKQVMELSKLFEKLKEDLLKIAE